MSATDALETQLLGLLFNNTDTTLDIGDAGGLRGSVTAGTFWVALHTAPPDSPGESPANQAVNEASYPGYARVEVIRSNTGSPNGGWTISGNQVSNAAEISFGQHTGGSPTSQTVTHYSIGTSDSASPASDVILFGALTSSLNVTDGITPRFSAGALVITLD
jgi:hypothetical protein